MPGFQVSLMNSQFLRLAAHDNLTSLLGNAALLQVYTMAGAKVD
jgi:hypothetical protein